MNNNSVEIIANSVDNDNAIQDSGIIAPIVMPPSENPVIGYYHDKEGRLWLKADDKSEATLISESYIEVTALTCTKESLEWSNRISFDDMDGKRRCIDISCKNLLEPRETQKILANSGFSKRWCTSKVVEYLKSVEPKNRLIQIDRTGWISETEYICPSFTVPMRDNYFLLGDTNNYGFAQKGKLEEWRKRICKPCEGNNILTVTLCVGLSGTLLRFFPTLSTTIINLFGKSSIGKTSALRVAASLWGGHKFIRQWRSTDNALEGSAEYYNDALMALDELGQTESKDASKIVYMLGNERGKGRSKADATLKKIREWRMPILSSGEIGIADKIEEGGKKAKGGILVRCIDIDAHISEKFGIFNTLHDFESGTELSNYFKNQTVEYHGTAAEAFIEYLSKAEPETIRDLYHSSRNKIFEKFALKDADCQVQRIAEMFALYLTTGLLASVDQYGVFTHNTEGIESAVYAVFERLLEDRGGKKSCEEREIIQHIIGFLMQHEARFSKLKSTIHKEDEDCDSPSKTEDDRTVYNRLGYIKECLDKTDYYIIPELFKEEVCKGLNLKTVKKILKKNNMLSTYEDGKNKVQYLDGKRIRMVAISVSN